MSDLYVSPSGSDDAPGTEAAPFRTIERARDELRYRKGVARPKAGSVRSASADLPCTVWLRGGVYELSEPIRFDHRDSAPVTYRAYPGEKPVIDGSTRIDGFVEDEVNGVRVWSTVIPEVKNGSWNFRQLFVGGHRAPRPRTPRSGLHRMERVPGLPESGGWRIGARYTQFVSAPGDARPFRNLHDVEVVYVHFWIEERSTIAAFNPDTRMVTMERPSRAPLFGSHGSHLADYYFDNVFEELGEPGEWYLDRPTGTLYYVPREGETIRHTEIRAPRTLQLLALTGDPDQGRFVEFLRFQGITFRNTDWRHPDPTDGGESIRPSGNHADFESRRHYRGDHAAASQAACDVPGVLFLEAARYCAFAGCTVRNVGWYGLEIADASAGVRVTHCTFEELGAGGVKIGGASAVDPPHRRTGGHTVSDCSIRGGGRIFHSGVGVLAMNTHSTTIAHNEISDLFYSGISCGWVWGFHENVSRDNRIEKNHIHTIGQGFLSDMGGIYTLGVQPGTVIRGNVIHDVEKAHYGGWCIYPDEGSSHLVIENNLCYNTNDTVFNQHYGRENIVRNNIFAFGDAAILALGRKNETDLSVSFEKNILLTKGSAIFRFGYGVTLADRNLRSDMNLLWDVNEAPFTITGKTTERTHSFEEWQAAGHDRHSVVADPGFRAPETGEFALPRGSAAEAIGFVPFDFSDVGPRTE